MATLNIIVFGNSLYLYLVAIALYIVFTLALKLFERIIFRKLKAVCNGTAFKRLNFGLQLFEQTVLPALYIGAFYLAFSQLTLAGGLALGIHAVWVVVLSFQVTRFTLGLLVYYFEEVWVKSHAKPPQAQVMKSVITILRILVWGVAGVFVLDNLGFNVAAIVAGLGIGGIAIALAAQTILGDLFNYFVIFFDRPFEEGDSIAFEDTFGVIENIGIKSTRIRALSGEQIVVSNSNLMASRIRNNKRMAERRVLFKLGIVYETPLEKLKQIPEMIRKIIEKRPATRVDRVHFKEFGDYSLNFEIVYFVQTSDFIKYMDIHQSINFEIFETFQREGIEFAYPTQMELQKTVR